ncbi:MAG: glycogen-binding domain-containing protein [bacterium]
MATKRKTSTKASINQKKTVNKTTNKAACKNSGNGSKMKSMAKPAPEPKAKPLSTSPSKPATKSIQFSYYAPDANQVNLAGDFNDWNTNSCSLTRSNSGEWTTSLQLKPGVYDYRFLVDGEWRDDPKSSERVPNSFGSQNDRIVVK